MFRLQGRQDNITAEAQTETVLHPYIMRVYIYRYTKKQSSIP